jgi:hypothetical protein
MVDVRRGSIGDGLRHRFDSFCDEVHVSNILLYEDIPLHLLVGFSCSSMMRISAGANTRIGRQVVVPKHNRAVSYS